MKNLSHLFYHFLMDSGLSDNVAKYSNMLFLLIASIFIVFVVYYIVKIILIKLFTEFAEKSKTQFDDVLVKNKVSKNIAYIFPMFVALELVPYVFVDFNSFENAVEKGLKALGVIMVLIIVRSLLNAARDYLKTFPKLNDKPIDSYIQVFMIFAWVVGGMLVFAVLTGVSIWKFFTALGAASAILILVFKDTILGFVASIQVAVNDMVRIGDWITFDKYGADGNVIVINLSTVKVQNFDKSVTTIPTYALISDSFRNWRGMEESQGRRIKRAIILRQKSIKYLSQEDVETFTKIDLITDYLKDKQADINAYNTNNKINKDVLLNGRNLTNIGVFRKYIETYLEHHSAINEDMMVMSRQLAPTSQGIPIEIYAFCKDKRWQNYEYIMADVFDHLLASITYFDLELFELTDSKNIIK